MAFYYSVDHFLCLFVLDCGIYEVEKMILLVSFLSVCVAAVLLWIGFIVSFLSSGQIASNAGYIITLMGLFLPFVIVAFAVAFVYMALEIKRLELRINDWVKALKCDILNDPVAVHQQIGEMVQEQLKQTEAPAVLNISKDEPITKYQNMELPEDVELHFKG